MNSKVEYLDEGVQDIGKSLPKVNKPYRKLGNHFRGKLTILDVSSEENETSITHF